MNVALTPELIRWLMGYDQDFRVIEPAKLKEAIDRKVDGMLAVGRLCLKVDGRRRLGRPRAPQ